VGHSIGSNTVESYSGFLWSLFKPIGGFVSLFELQAFSAGGLAPWDLALGASECITLTGPSGSGKSRLLRAMADLDPHQGVALLEGRPCLGYSPCQWRHSVGLLPAESAWWGIGVGEHFAHEPRAEALAALGFRPEVMGWEVGRCSTGERQRLALLRLLDNRPQVLLLDEPTASLDPSNVAAAEALITGYLQAEGAAAIWVSHDPQQARRVAQRHYNIEAGRVAEVKP
jgi:ABC-type iron transport system FetAB ATPase subunit